MSTLYYLIEAINPKGEEVQYKFANEELSNKNQKWMEDHGYTCLKVTRVTEDIYGR
jgi:hypothetical protein